MKLQTQFTMITVVAVSFAIGNSYVSKFAPDLTDLKLFLSLGNLVLAWIVPIFTTKFIFKPLAQMIEAMRHIADGDANAIAKTLTDSGYKVTLITSTDPQGRYKSANNLEQAIDDFAQTQALGAEKVVVWYTGHGHAVAQGQSDPKNLSAKQIDDYILPADYNRGDDPAVKGVNVAKLTNVASASNFVALFIDACRTQTAEGANSTNAGFRAIGTQRKLNGVTIKHDNLYIVYSTQPNAPASDGPAGQHSPFAQAFLDVLTQGGINREMATIFSGIQKRTRELSQQLTGKDQTPIADDQLPVVGSFNLANTEASTGGQKLAAK